jgi:hypothetical protein
VKACEAVLWAEEEGREGCWRCRLARVMVAEAAAVGCTCPPTNHEQLWFSDCATPTLAEIPPLFDKVIAEQVARVVERRGASLLASTSSRVHDAPRLQ